MLGTTFKYSVHCIIAASPYCLVNYFVYAPLISFGMIPFSSVHIVANCMIFNFYYFFGGCLSFGTAQGLLLASRGDHMWYPGLKLA